MRAKATKGAGAKARQSPKTRDADATRAAFVAAGERVFARSGFGGATLDMLAAEAGANKALVSYYFGSKAGLYDVVVTTLARAAIGSLTGNFKESDDPARDCAIYIEKLAETLAGRPTFLAILMREYVGGSMQARQTPAQEVLQFFKITERLYERGRKAKLFRKVDPHLLHLSIIGPIIHFVLTAPFRDAAVGTVIHGVSKPSVAAFSAHLSSLVLGGLRRTD
jgi:TetR/AcrR family transcriptional regulator